MPVPPLGAARARHRHRHLVRPAAQRAVSLPRHRDQALPQVVRRPVVVVAEALVQQVGHRPGGLEVDRVQVQQREREQRLVRPAGHPAGTSSAHTSIRSSTGPPNVVTIATSSASLPRPIRTRPLRASLLRGSKVNQVPSR